MTAAPPAARGRPAADWRLSALAGASMAVGGGAGVAAGHPHAALIPGLIALFVAVAALAGPRGRLWHFGLLAGALTFAMLMLAYVTEGSPVAAGLAMAVVSFIGAMAVAAGAGVGAAGSILSAAYFIPAAAGVIRGLSAGQAVELGLLGVLAGLLVTLVAVLAGAVRPAAGDVPPAPRTRPPAADAVRASLRARDETFDYAVRRALALGIAMGVYQAHPGRTVFWVMLTMFIVMQPARADSWQRAINRSAGVIVGCLAVSGLAQVAPARVIMVIAVVVLLAGVAYYRTVYAVYSAGLSFATIAFIAAERHDVTTWAALRIADTLLGVAISLVVTLLVLPAGRGGRGAAP